MPNTTMRRDALRTAIVAAVTLLVLVISACSPPVMAHACGTSDRPPVALDRAACDRAQPGAVWYSGRADDLDEPDEQVVIGQPLDEDWYDPRAQADLDDRVHHGTGHSAPRVSTPPRSSTASAPTTTRTAPPTTTTRKPSTTRTSR